MGASASSPRIPSHDQSFVGRRGFFHVGGEYVGEGDEAIMRGQAYVEVIEPVEVRKPYPLVFVHGTAQTSTNWLGTPDGRPGWADFFVRQGYVVHLLEQPMRGRSAWHPGDGPTRMFTTRELESLFTATAELGTWPQAKRHTQWPGTGRRGDPAFDAFYASQVETLVSAADTERSLQQAGVALLDRIGPAILVTHSQAAYFSWHVTDKRPRLVKGNIALEPAGPPCENLVFGKGPNRIWGLANIPLEYAPAAADPSELRVEKVHRRDRRHLAPCWRQIEPARQLPNLAGIPTLVLVGEASYHAMFAHCTADWLRQAGVDVELVRLEDENIFGNGHMFMLERNSLEIAAFLDRWMSRRIA